MSIRFDQIAVHEEGRGVPVLLLHGSASDCRQWRSLTGFIEGRHRVIAPDLPGYGGSRASARGQAPSLAELAESLQPILRDGPVHVVGHSFGGAVALKVACMFPGQVRSLTLIEPAAVNTLWTEYGLSAPATWRFRAAMQSSAAMLAEGDAWNAMRALIDFWNGEGTWERTSFGLRQTLAAQVGQVHADYAALEGDATTALDLAGVVCPVLSLRGSRSPAVTRTVTDHLCRTIPFVREEVVEGAGHLLPLTDPHVVDPMIGDFLARVDRTWQDAFGPITLAA